MKLIQQRKLFFNEGNSDKVYEIDLCELSPDKYLVNFRYGRRGSTLKEGTKTPTAVLREQADILFAELENEKRKKGYQTEMETFVALPSLDDIDVKSVKGAILHRLQDAVTGAKSFSTEWKTSRVIWKAGILHIEEAIPSIIKLANKGDDLLLYCALWALVELKASQAGALFTATAMNVKQKKHIRNLCWEGLLTISQEEERSKLNVQLLAQLPGELRYAIETSDDILLRAQLASIIKEGLVDCLPVLYLLCKIHTWLLPIIAENIGVLPFRPPCFKQIRSIYKLAQLRKDTAIVAVLSYRFEKEGAMFKRTGPLNNDRKRLVPQINQFVKVGAELKKEESKIAFSHFTKEYFQKNSVEYLRNTGVHGGAKAYLKLAIATLLQYTEADYTAAGERPLNYYGHYNYQTRLYRFTLINYPECSESLLLSTILFGNDINRKLEPNLKFVLGKRIVTSRKYSYSPNDLSAAVVSPADNPVGRGISPRPDSKPGFITTVVNGLKSIFGKKSGNTAPKNEVINIPSPVEVPEETKLESSRAELYPEHWDIMPEAYVQLLMQARMSVIHQFAFNNLKAHSKFEEIINRFDQKSLLQLLSSEFPVPGQFGFEVLRKREMEFSPLPGFIGQVLNCNNAQVREWALVIVDGNIEMYLDDLDFAIMLLFNVRPEISQWISGVLSKTSFSEDRIQAILGKATTELLHLDNTKSNNELARNAISRLQILAAQQMERVSWNIVAQLISSPLEANKILAGEILIKRSKHTTPTEIPILLTALFLKSEIPEIRRNGVLFLEQYPDEFLLENLSFVLDQTESTFRDAAETGLSNIRKLLTGDPIAGNAAILHLVYTLMRKEKFEGAHLLIGQFVSNDLKPFWSSGLKPKDIIRLIHSQYRIGQLAGYDILKTYNRPEELSIGQIISFGSHEVLAIRQWCWNYFAQDPDRVRREKDKALNLLDSEWDDTRAFAFHFFNTEFTATDWEADTLISIVDSVRPDVESFGKGLITRWFKEDQAMEYLTRLSEHPSVNVQAFISNYLSLYATDKPELLSQLDFYFRSVLSRVNKARVAKDRIFDFLRQEAIKSEVAAKWVASIIDDIAVQDTIGDKAICIDILTDIKNHYKHMEMHLFIKN